MRAFNVGRGVARAEGKDNLGISEEKQDGGTDGLDLDLGQNI